MPPSSPDRYIRPLPGCPTGRSESSLPPPVGRAQTLVEHYQHSPQHTVKIHHFDPDLAVMVMEDLSSHRIWRGELINNIYYPQAARQLGEYLAHALFHTSDFFLHPHAKKAQVRPSWKMTSRPCATTLSLKLPWPP